MAESLRDNLVPEKPIPEQDPITGKSYAIHYVIATVILMARCSGRCRTRPGDNVRGKRSRINGRIATAPS